MTDMQKVREALEHLVKAVEETERTNNKIINLLVHCNAVVARKVLDAIENQPTDRVTKVATDDDNARLKAIGEMYAKSAQQPVSVDHPFKDVDDDGWPLDEKTSKQPDERTKAFKRWVSTSQGYDLAFARECWDAAWNARASVRESVDRSTVLNLLEKAYKEPSIDDLEADMEIGCRMSVAVDALLEHFEIRRQE